MNDLDHLVKVRPHLQYARDIIDGHIVANKLVIATCNRSINEHMADLLNEESKWTYLPKFANAVVKFASFVPHIKGDFATRRKTFILPPWQLYFVSELYGWRKRDASYIRRFTEGYLEVAKKNGKSSLAAVLALYEVLYGDHGGEVYSAATVGHQSQIVWDIAADMIPNLPPKLREQYTITTGNGRIFSNRAIFRYLSTDGGAYKKLDGKNPSFIIYDEAAAIDESAIFEKLSTRGRRSYCKLYITHPYQRITTPYYEDRQSIVKALEGVLSSKYIERKLPILYGLEEEEEIEDEKTWIKANPNLGASVDLEETREEVSQVTISGSKRRLRALQVYTFGMWVSAADTWLEHDALDGCVGDVQRMENVCIGVDLSATKDLTAVARIWPQANKWYCDFKCWTTQKYVDSVPDDLKEMYYTASDAGILEIQGFEAIEDSEVYDYIRETGEEYNIISLGIDPHNASKMLRIMGDDGYPTVLVSQSPQKLNEPARELEARISKNTFIYDGDPFITWQFSNCVAYLNNRELLAIRKPDPNSPFKIDAVAALITAAATVHDAKQPELSSGVRYLPL